MKSFKEYHDENNPGNYVSVDVDNMPQIDLSNLSGKPNPKPHITLVYSKQSAVPLSAIQQILEKNGIAGKEVKISDVKIFDALDKGESTGCVVLGIDSPELFNLHQKLLSVGCKHSYNEFSPHATVVYDATLDDCKKLKQSLEHSIVGKTVTLTTFNNDVIKKDWANSA